MARFSWRLSWCFWRSRRVSRSCVHKGAIRPFLECLEDRLVPSTYTVTSTADDGSAGTLGWAINQSNSSAGPNLIDFDIPAAGIQTISLGSALPQIVNNAVTIDATTQPGYNATNGAPVVEMFPATSGVAFSGLDIVVPGCTIKGLAIGGLNTGILLEATANNTTIADNYLGTDATGMNAVGNNAGIEVLSSSNTIGGTVGVASRNIISGNTNSEVIIDGGPGTVVDGNYIGPDPTGRAVPLGAGARTTGVFIGEDITIGGTASGAGNLISGNGGSGILMDNGGASALVQGNDIGTDASGAMALPNTYGIFVTAGVMTIGGSVSGARNIISGNLKNGIDLESSDAVVEGNYIGTTLDGSARLGNGKDGVFVEADNNTIGDGNVISGNVGYGVEIAGAYVSVQGNYIGTTADGSAGLGNGNDGVFVDEFTNTIGDVVSGNVISGNVGYGLEIAGSGVSVQGNYIGTDISGNHALGNVAGGVAVDQEGTNAVIGNFVGNVISGNGAGNTVAGLGFGISIDASGVVVQSNYIGTNAAGAALGNSSDGIFINSGGTNATIGGTAPPFGNVISDNGGNGIEANAPVVVQSNLIGTDVSGNVALGNTGDGVLLGSGAAGSLIGGTGAGNIISGNGDDGVFSGASGTSVAANYIGVNAAGAAALGNGKSGVVVSNAAADTIGGTAGGARNLISGNSGQGVYILGARSNGTLVYGNDIGTDTSGSAKLGNGANGVYISNASGNFIGGSLAGAANVVSGNGQSGILIAGPLATGNSVLANLIGTDGTGTTNLGNGQQGILIDSAGDNTIGSPTAPNVISANAANGVEITGGGAHGNTIGYDLIGTDITGTKALGNAANGVYISNAPGNRVTGNVVSANGASGVLIASSSAVGNLVDGNLVGTDISGSMGLGNTLYGVFISNAGGNTVGVPAGTVSPGADANVISGNKTAGVVIAGPSASANLVQGNVIGTDLLGGTAVANLGDGVLLEGPCNTVQGNTISGNQANGVEIVGTFATGNHVQGNHIGTDVSGTSALANSLNGVEVESAGNFIGGASAGNGNLISGNGNSRFQIGTGVYLAGALATGNTVAGNFIGTDATGTTALGNYLGLWVSGNGNTIGGTAPGAGNVISGNFNGVELDTSNNLVLGNHIGTDVFGATALPNENGLFVYGADNSIGAFYSGGNLVTAGNLISGNFNDGVFIVPDFGDGGNLIAANRIGTDGSGTKQLANGTGVRLDGASNNTIGGTALGAGNIISGNTYVGLLLGSNSTHNLVQGNLIGTTAAGNAGFNTEVQLYSLPNGDGVEIQSDSNNNTIGGTAAGAGNLIADNTGSGIVIGGPVDNTNTGTVVQGNYIGNNTGHGILLAGNNNTIGGTAAGAANSIEFNGTDGVSVSAGNGNAIQRNVFYLNGPARDLSGIVLATGANNGQAAPVLGKATYDPATQILTVTGKLAAKAGTTYTLEFFANVTGDPEGKIYLGTQNVTASGSSSSRMHSTGAASFTFTVKTSLVNGNPLITGTATDPNGNTSAFSAGAVDPPAKHHVVTRRGSRRIG
jgi:hypothetical protein